MNKHWDETIVQPEPPAPTAHDAGGTRRPDETAVGELHFRELIYLLRRRSRLILTIALCGTTLVFAAGLLMPPKYTAKAEIVIEPPSGAAQAAAPMRDDGIIEMHMNMLLSRDHLQRVLGDLPDNPGVEATPPSVHRAELQDAADRAARRTAASRWLPTPSELAQRRK